MKRYLLPLTLAAATAFLSIHYLEKRTAHAVSIPTAGKPHIAQWYNDADAALSYTFDDGLQCHADIAAPMLHQFNIRATFYVIAGLARQHPSDPRTPVPRLKFGEGALSWDEIRTIHNLGMEIGNHSLTHAFLNTITDEKILDLQINHSADLITQNVGQRPLTFAFPYNEWSPHAKELVLQNHIAIRDHWTDYGGPTFTAAIADNLVEKAIHNHAWLVPMIHGINSGFLPLNSDVLRANLAFVKAHENDLWVTTYSEVARYQIERDAATLKIKDSEPGEATFSITDPPLRAPAVPLTIVLPLPLNNNTDQVSAKDDTNNQSVPVTREPDRILVNLPPNDSVTVTWH